MEELKKYLITKDYKIIGNKYFDRGGHGQLYKCRNLTNNKIYALKIEERKKNYSSTLYNEMKIYRKIKGSEKNGIPKIILIGKTNQYYYIIMKMYKKNLDDLKNAVGGSFTMPTIMNIGLQVVNILHLLHKQNIIHRDIKPENTMIDNQDRIFLIDYGLAKQFTDLNDSKLFNKECSKSRCGTVRYMSIQCHKKTKLSRKDDLLSLGYMLVYLYIGNLPWQGLDISDKKEKDEAVYEIKDYYGINKLCKRLPSFFKNYFNHLNSLSQSDRPDYNLIKNLFITEMKTSNFDTSNYDWSVLD